MKLLTYYNLFLFSFIPTITAQDADLPSGNCTTFNWEPEGYFYLRYSENPERISAALSCPDTADDTQNCALVANGDLLVSWTTNTSRILHTTWASGGEVENPLYYWIHEKLEPSFSKQNPDFNETIIGVISQVLPLAPGTAGYINFFPLLRCVTGTMSNCTGNIEDGLGIEACAPVASRDDSGLRILDGKSEIKNVSAADVGNYSDPFANQSRGGSAAEKDIRMGWSLFYAALLATTAIIII